MHFFCKQKDFLNGLLITQKAIDTQNTLPVLTNVFIEAKDKEIYLSATNLEISIQTSIKADIKKEGMITIPARILTSWVSFIKDEEIEFKLKDSSTAILKTKSAKTNLKGMEGKEFPAIPTVEMTENNQFKILAKDLREGINEVIFSCAHSSVRPVLSGVLIHNRNKKDKKIYFASSDSYRLGIREIDLEEELKEDIYCIVPARTLIEVERILSKIKDDQKIKVAFSQNQISFQIDTETEQVNKFCLTSRLIDGKFPDYKLILPESIEKELIINKENLLLAIKRVGLFAKQNKNDMKFLFKKDKLIITTNETEMGVEEADVPIIFVEDKTGTNEAQISLNGQFVLDALAIVPDDEVILNIREKIAPTIIRKKSQEKYTHVIMPLKI